MAAKFGVTVRADSGPGVLHQLTGVIARRRGDISTVEIIGQAGGEARIYFEIKTPGPPEGLVEELRALPIGREGGLVKTLHVNYGERGIIMGGGALGGQGAISASSATVRHNNL